MDDRNVITKSNHLIEAGYKLSLNEQRLVLASISVLDSRKAIPKKIRINAQEFAEQFEIPKNKAYVYLAEAADKLYERDIQTYDGQYDDRFRWLSRRRYAKGEGYVEISFSDEISVYLTRLQKSFTSYKYSLVRHLKSPYSIRLFEMLIRWKDTGQLIIKLVDFKTRLEVDGMYDRFTNLKSRIISPAIKELEAHCGMKIKFRPIKNGRTIERIEFTFTMDEQLQLELS